LSKIKEGYNDLQIILGLKTILKIQFPNMTVEINH